VSINSQSGLPQIPLPWLAGYMMGNYSEEEEEEATFNESPVTITPSLQICGRENETRKRDGRGRRKGREKEQQRGVEMKGYISTRGGGGGGTVLDSFRFNKDVGSFKIVFSLSVFIRLKKGESTVRWEPHINGGRQTFNSQSDWFSRFPLKVCVDFYSRKREIYVQF